MQKRGPVSVQKMLLNFFVDRQAVCKAVKLHHLFCNRLVIDAGKQLLPFTLTEDILISVHKENRDQVDGAKNDHARKKGNENIPFD
jgi:hypothetical protein